ncbi:MAG: SidJ-related pseudokinase [Thermodesulfobacteriota bacterium]
MDCLLCHQGWNLEKECADAANYLLGGGKDFSATYMTAANLYYIAETQPASFNTQTVYALQSVLTGKAHSAQRQAFFLYKKAADTLSVFISTSRCRDTADLARQSLFDVLCRTTGPAFRAAAEALGSLPLKLRGPAPADEAAAAPVDCRWETILSRAGAPFDQTPDIKGRNLVLPLADGRLLVVKTAGRASAVAELAAEIGWMTYLSDKMENGPGADCRFAVPQPVTEQVLRLKGLPVVAPGVAAGSECYAAAFIAPGNYFTYPNESIDHRLPPQSELKAILVRNARLLGQLTAKGVIHTATIPLFHNRVQRQRRTDAGLYEWHRAGRLDRWLASCRYPNIGASGIRDFEHFISFSEPPRRLYQHVGTHILSLVLVAGSYFRYQAPEKIGLQPDGKPVDVRHRFDREFLQAVMEAIFVNYYEGFAGKAFEGNFPLNIENTVDRLVDAFGVDRHMTETLRAADQQEMCMAAFEAFLADRGFEPHRIAEMEKGEADLVIETGPHLGDFNDRISVPELIEFTAAASAMCIAGRYFSERFR